MKCVQRKFDNIQETIVTIAKAFAKDSNPIILEGQLVIVDEDIEIIEDVPEYIITFLKTLEESRRRMMERLGEQKKSLEFSCC